MRVLHRRGFQLFADRFVDRDARFAVITENADFNQTVRIQAGIDFLQDAWRQSGFANHHDWIQWMGIGTQCCALDGA